MTLQELESNWKRIEPQKKSIKELDNMTHIKNNPKIKRTRIQFLIEFLAIVTFLLFYYDIFDGDKKPLWANILLVVTALGFVLTRLIAWITIRNPIRGNNLNNSLQGFSNRIKQVVVLILLTSFLFGSALITFFVSSIEPTGNTYVIIIGMVLSLLLLIYLSIRNWFVRIKTISKTIQEFSHPNEN